MIRHLFKLSFVRKCNYWRYYLYHQWYAKSLKQKEHINVVFLCMNVPMWKCGHVFDLLRQNNRFKVFLFLSPAQNFTYKQRCNDLKEMRAYFTERGIDYIDFELEAGKPPVPIRDVVDPDLIFYPQPYPGTFEDVHSYEYFIKKLILYVPYAFVSRNAQYYDFNSEFSNLAWRLYYPTEESRKIATRNTFIHGRNVVVTGYSSADDYSLPMKKDPWKTTNRPMKRIVWAPHFTIRQRLGFSQISNFLEVADYMKQLAGEYHDKVQFAFKPHPRLYTELCKYPDWGKERANEYYNFWLNGSNTQLETGDFIDLFKGSDALIHDSGSFTIDYLYFGKPVLYDNPNIEDAKRTGTPICQMAYDMHYKSQTVTDIKHFIDEVVLAGNDTMKEERMEFCNKYLMPSNGMSVARNIYLDIIQSLAIYE